MDFDKVMPFGKYKDQKIEAVAEKEDGRKYLEWFLTTEIKEQYRKREEPRRAFIKSVLEAYKSWDGEEQEPKESPLGNKNVPEILQGHHPGTKGVYTDRAASSVGHRSGVGRYRLRRGHRPDR